MTALGMVLSSLGIKVTDETRAQIEVLIPQIPARVVQAVEAINASVAKVHELAARIEDQRLKLESLELRLEAMQILAVERHEELKEILHGRNQHVPITAAPDGPGSDAPGSDSRYINGNPNRRKRNTGTAN